MINTRSIVPLLVLFVHVQFSDSSSTSKSNTTTLDKKCLVQLRLNVTRESHAEFSVVGWDKEGMLRIRDLLSQPNPPSWATSAKRALVWQAQKRVGLPSGLRPGVSSGPWSLTNKRLVPPSGDKRDYMTTSGYFWPCNTTCQGAGFSNEKCTKWNAGARTFGPCNTATGLPWEGHDGFFNTEGLGDLYTMIVMMDTVEILTLAWWFDEGHPDRNLFAEQAASVLRMWFLNNSTRMNPRLLYGASIPGKYEGTAGAIIAPSFRLNSRLVDCVELLKTAGPQIWTAEDSTNWITWATAWLEWLQTSKFGKDEMGVKGNHATFLLIHKLALAHATKDSTSILQIVKTIREGLPGSLASQIKPDGEMPVETKRVLGATYSKMNIDGLFRLGVVVQNVCRSLACIPAWDWKWEMASAAKPSWQLIRNQASYCKYLGRGSIESLESCQQDCIAHHGCNGVVTRTVGKNSVLRGCYFKRCIGTDYKLRGHAGGWSVYNTYTREEIAPPKSGSIQRALEYLLPYAHGNKSWSQDHTNTVKSDANLGWAQLTTALRIAASAFQEPRYNTEVELLDPRWQFSVANLVFPPDFKDAP